MTAESTWLWQRAFNEPREDATPEEQAFFLSHLKAMRERAGLLVARIGADMPDMTVHDLSHLDALWEMASILASGQFELNPPEAFVFGGAVLLHDAAMTLAAFPDGIEGLKREVVWQDAYSRFWQQAIDRSRGAQDPSLEQLATAEALRQLHAAQAEKLSTMAWPDPPGDPQYLIADPELRSFYGRRIGQVAHSHWWFIGQVEEELARDLGPLGGRTHNRIDLVKIACLLRAADAMHLDRRRAPPFLKALLNPQGVSQAHWAFQAKMAVPYVSQNALVFSASAPFAIQEAEAWWLAFDAITMVDRELRDIDRVLRKRGPTVLSAARVEGAGDPLDLAQHLETEGWRPVDSRIRVSDVPKIVSTLGGEKLYGDDATAPVRELIQNGNDAVIARRTLQNRAGDWGTVSVTTELRGDDHWLIIEDEGVGMSETVMTGPLIDFGNSFWRSPLASREFPGLQSRGIAATGRYGIGFFSVFMLGALVRVFSRRYDRGIDTLRLLEFSDGLGSRPILYDPTRPDLLLDGGTRIEVRLARDPRQKGGFLEPRSYPPQPQRLRNAVARLAPAVSVRLRVDEDGEEAIAVEPRDWAALEEWRLVARLSGKDAEEPKHAGPDSRLRPLQGPDAEILGRAAIETSLFGSSGGCISVGGLRSTNLDVIRGVIDGREVTASRNEASPNVPAAVLHDWATEQARLIVDADLDPEDEARAAQVVLMSGGDVGELAIVRIGGEWLSRTALIELLYSVDELSIIVGDVQYDGDLDDVHPREFARSFEEAKDVLFIPNSVPGWSGSHDRRIFRRVVQDGPASIEELFGSLLRDHWPDTPPPAEQDQTVGSVAGESIVRSVHVVRRKGDGDEAD